MEDELDGKQFIIYSSEASKMLSWLSPFIEKAGYYWKTEQHYDNFGVATSAMKLTIQKQPFFTRSTTKSSEPQNPTGESTPHPKK